MSLITFLSLPVASLFSGFVVVCCTHVSFFVQYAGVYMLHFCISARNSVDLHKSNQTMFL